MSLYANCRHCGAPVDEDPDQGWLWVHVGTRSRRCPGAEVTTEAEPDAIPA